MQAFRIRCITINLISIFDEYLFSISFQNSVVNMFLCDHKKYVDFHNRYLHGVVRFKFQISITYSFFVDNSVYQYQK